MIDTKIACQCGNRFKFGMGLVNGRAPDGLVCPTCGAPASPACNALVDFLSGKVPAAATPGPRSVKEIKVTCTCGARYKFDLELEEQEMPSPVQCPGCQADLTPLANEEIRNYVARHAVGLADASTAATTPATVPATRLDTVAPPAAAAPAIAPPPASPYPAATASPTAAPAIASVITSPTSPASPTAPAATLVADSPVPAPTGKTSGPNLRPLEAPKPNRVTPGSAPASAPAAPAPALKSAKPDSPKPIAAPAAASREPSVALGVAGAVAGAVIGAGLWFAVLKSTGLSGSFMAAVLGTFAGFGARLLGRGASSTMGGVACISASLAIGLMVWLAMTEHVNRENLAKLKGKYDLALAEAKAAAGAKTDAELKLIAARNVPNADPDSSHFSDDDLKAFRITRLPEMLNLATGKTSRAQFESRKLAEWRSGSDWMEVWQDSVGILGLLWLIAGVGSAARIALR